MIDTGATTCANEIPEYPKGLRACRVIETNLETRTIEVDLVIETEAGKERILGTATVEP